MYLVWYLFFTLGSCPRYLSILDSRAKIIFCLTSALGAFGLLRFQTATPLWVILISSDKLTLFDLYYAGRPISPKPISFSSCRRGYLYDKWKRRVCKQANMPEEREEEEWYNGNSYSSLQELFQLVRINDNHFESGRPAYSPGGFKRAYGGHVFAQAALAAARTVREGMVVHVSFFGLFFSFLWVIGSGWLGELEEDRYNFWRHGSSGWEVWCGVEDSLFYSSHCNSLASKLWISLIFRYSFGVFKIMFEISQCWELDSTNRLQFLGLGSNCR